MVQKDWKKFGIAKIGPQLTSTSSYLNLPQPQTQPTSTSTYVNLPQLTSSNLYLNKLQPQSTLNFLVPPHPYDAK